MNDLFFGGKWHFSHAMPILEPIYPSKKQVIGGDFDGTHVGAPPPGRRPPGIIPLSLIACLTDCHAIIANCLASRFLDCIKVWFRFNVAMHAAKLDFYNKLYKLSID